MSPTRILLIDDDRQWSEMLKDRLEHEGYVVGLAFDGETGLEQVGEFQPHLILLDLQLPAVSGVEFLNRISKETREIPVIVISAFATGALGHQARQHGAREVWQKPLDEAKLSRLHEYFAVSEFSRK